MNVKKKYKKISSISIVLPTYNEAYSIAPLLKKLYRILPKVARKYEVIIVNDASQDTTAKVLEAQKATYKNLFVFHHKVKNGYSRSLISGFKKSKYDYIFYTDDEGKRDISELTKLVERMDATVDVVSGFRTHTTDKWSKKINVFLYNQCAKLLFGLRIKDMDCDFRLIRKSTLDRVNLRIPRSAFEVDLMKKMQDKKAIFKEVPIVHVPSDDENQDMSLLKKEMKSFWSIFLLRFSFS